jgi:hypothetical protein
MANVHASLSPKSNAILLAAWTAGAVAVSLIAPLVPWLLLALGTVFGAILGLMQRQALRESRAVLIATQTAMDVRRALTGSRPGRAYLYALWGSALLILTVAFALPHGGRYYGGLAGYFALAAIRELITLRETFVLQTLAVEPTT